MYFLDCGIAFTDKATNRRNLHVTAANKAFAVWSHSLNCLLKKLGCMKKALQATKQTNVLLRALINLVIPTIIWVRGSQLLRHLQTAITMNLLQMPLNIDGLLGHHTAVILLVFLQFLQPPYVDSVSLV